MLPEPRLKKAKDSLGDCSAKENFDPENFRHNIWFGTRARRDGLYYWKKGKRNNQTN